MGLMATYDPALIVKFSDKLYSKSRGIIFAHGFVGFIGGSLFSLVLLFAVPPMKSSGWAVWLVCAGIFILIGAAHGRAKGFELRLRAQIVLCQLQTEIHLKNLQDHIIRSSL